MLSIIVYGRNDNHGYNLHKRASISLNCLSEILQNEEDEIIFVDWNTPINLPTFPEAISDTLTEKTKKFLKIIRVRPDIHKKLTSNFTNKPTIEPIARNTALIRTNPENRWILSTNTDIILLLDENFNLSKYLSSISDGLYEAPRLSIPDGLWETFDRKNPKDIFTKLDFFRNNIDLDEIVSTGNIQQYDAPGDFQLVPRVDLIKVGGFDEEMLKGWGVDSNLCKRMHLFYGETKIISDHVKVYHCEHTRFLTHFTKSDDQNDSNKFYYFVKSYDLPRQKSFGLENIDLEKFSLNDLTSRKINTLINNSKTPLTPRSPIYTQKSGSLVSYPADHALPYILDIFDGADETDQVFYLGQYGSMKEKIISSLKSWKNLTVQSTDLDSENKVLIKNISQINEKGFTYFIFDFGADLEINADISNFTHANDKYKNFFKRNNLHNLALDLIQFIIEEKRDISKIVFIFLNAETYGHGTGNRIRDFVPLQQVAINSRVRFGQINPELKKISSNLLRFMIKQNKLEIDTYINFSNKLSKNSITSHSFFHNFYNDIENFTFLEIGTFIDKESKIFTNNLFKHGKEIIFELDYPNLAGTTLNKLSVEVFNNSRSFYKFLNFKGIEGETVYFKIAETDLSEHDKILYFRVNEKKQNSDFDADRIYQIRITNLLFISKNKQKKWYKLRKLQDTMIHKSGWSYSNERLGRWVIDSKFEVLNPNPSNHNYPIFIIFNASDYIDNALQLRLDNLANGSILLKKLKLPKIHNIIYFCKVNNMKDFNFSVVIPDGVLEKVDLMTDNRIKYFQFSDLILTKKFFILYLFMLIIKNTLSTINKRVKFYVFFEISSILLLSKLIKILDIKKNTLLIRLKSKNYSRYLKYMTLIKNQNNL